MVSCGMMCRPDNGEYCGEDQMILLERVDGHGSKWSNDQLEGETSWTVSTMALSHETTNTK